MLELTKKQMEVIEDNLRAYKTNFEYIEIEYDELTEGFYVYTSQQAKEQGEFFEYFYNIDYLNGWLWGCVQTVNNKLKPKKKITFD